MKKIILTESDITKIVRKSIEKKLYEDKFSNESENLKEKDEIDEGADTNEDGEISKDELHKHFDDNKDGKVTPKEYKKHIDFHKENPELLSKKKSVKEMVNRLVKKIR